MPHFKLLPCPCRITVCPGEKVTPALGEEIAVAADGAGADGADGSDAGGGGGGGMLPPPVLPPPLLAVVVVISLEGVLSFPA